MLKLRHTLLLLGLLFAPPASADVQVSIGIGLPHVSIGINVPAYPRLVPIPGYPVYYAPSLRANFFFYDGMYWVYQDDYWYASSWYNGPWWIVEPTIVPVFILRVPVRYYSRPPIYFRSWRSDAPPRWGDHWGRDWEQRRGDWDRWDRRSAPPPAPPPDYQRQYSGDRYPRQVEQQYELHQQNYRYQPQEPAVREHYQEQIEKRSPGRRDDTAGPRSQPPSREDRDVRKSPAAPQERQEAPDRRPSQQRESEPREQAGQRAPDRQGKPQQDRQGTMDERDSSRQDMQQQRQQEPRSQPQPKEDRERKPPPASSQQGRQEAPDRKPPSQRESEQREQPGQAEPDQRGGYVPDKRGNSDDRDASQQDMQSPRRQQEPRSQQPQGKDKKDDSKSVPGHPKDDRSQYQNHEQAVAESGLYGFRSTARSRAIRKIQVSEHILKINAGTRTDQLWNEQTPEDWKSKAYETRLREMQLKLEALQLKLDELQKIEKSMMNRH